MTKLEQLKEIIQKANPEIMELKFGCKVNRNVKYNEIISGFFNNKIALKKVDKDGGWLPFNVPKKLSKNWKILGRSITFTDVLITLNKKKWNDNIKIAPTLGTTNKPYWSYDELIKLLTYWNLQKDLDGQSPETINWFYNLLKT